MDKEELNAKLGYNRELLNQLSNAFDLQEDYNDYGWDKLFEICRYIYNLEQQCKKQKEVIDKINNYIDNYDIFKVFSFPLMKRWEEEQVKSSINYEFKTSLIKDLKDILKEVSE